MAWHPDAQLGTGKRPPFSQRTSWDLDTPPLAQALAEHKRRGLPLCDLTETNPTRVQLPMPWPAIAAALVDSGNAAYAPEPFGLASARQAIAAYHDHRVPAEHIVVCASTSEGYAYLFKLLCDPGDEILVPAPSYPLFEYLAGLESVRACAYPSRYADGWHLDLHALATSLTPRARAVLVVSPNNPTGAALHPAEAEALTALCAQHRLALLCDEVFADTLARGTPERVASLAGNQGCLTVVLSGLSKVCLLPQLKLGWLAVSGPPQAVSEALQRLEIVADTYLSVGTPVQRALPQLLALRDEIQAPLLARLSHHRRLLAQACAGTSATLLRSDGGWCAVLRVPQNRTEEQWVLHLLACGVWVHPGYYFDFAGEGFLVLSLLPAPASFREGLAILRAVLLPDLSPTGS